MSSASTPLVRLHPRRATPIALVAVLLGTLTMTSAAHAQDLEWVRQIGSGQPGFDTAQAVDADGYVYIVGGTSGSLGGEPHAGSNDAYVRKYSPDGAELWTREFGTTTHDFATGVAVDENGVYVLGQTSGPCPAKARPGSPTTSCAS